MHRKIKKVAVLGSGIMGSRIACHFANIGVNVLLLDIVPNELNEKEKKQGLTFETKSFRNRMVNESLEAAVKSNPSPLYKKAFKERIITGNFSDDLKEVSSCDWILEAVVENIDIKTKLFEQVELHRKHGTIITSNTSGIPIQLLIAGRSTDFKHHFCGTHFFNPPRYLPLLEIIPTTETLPTVAGFLLSYGEMYLGKTTILCKDTPAFIANRIGVFAIMDLFHKMEHNGLTVEEVDKLTGPVFGRPKSATFRTCDIVGLDTLVHVANGLGKVLLNDERKEVFALPGFIQKMIENKWLGDKSKQGFYKKTKSADGKTEILSLDLKNLEYKQQVKTKFAALEQTKTIDSLAKRLPVLLASSDKAGDFYRSVVFSLLSYTSLRIPEISNDIWHVDEAMKAGFGWELGPFEMWDVLGVDDTCKKMKHAGLSYAPWIDNMLQSGHTSFYDTSAADRKYYSLSAGTYSVIPGLSRSIQLNYVTGNKILWKNSGCTITDIGDGIINLEFHTKMNTIGSEIIEGVNKIIDMAEKDFAGVVIANQGANFSAGANLALIYMLALEQEWDEIDLAIRMFQKTSMRIRYSAIPVVIAPHGLSLGGGCEMSLHADKVIAAAETYTGLVEFGVGLIPGGGGTKEMTLRLSDDLAEGNIGTNQLRNVFITIAQAKVSTSAHEAFDLGFYRAGIDQITINKKHLLANAKNACLQLIADGYVQPIPRSNIKVTGRTGLGIITAGASAMMAGNYISEHDKIISEKLGYIMCGGNLSAPATVSERYLLDLEREAFLSLCGMKKTLERIQSILTSGKILRN